MASFQVVAPIVPAAPAADIQPTSVVINGTGTVRVRTNEGYSLYLQSQNRSYLKRTSLTAQVRYTAEVGGVPIDLTPTGQRLAAHVAGVTAAQGTP